MYLVKVKRIFKSSLNIDPAVITFLEYGIKSAIKSRLEWEYPNWAISFEPLDEITYNSMVCERSEETAEIFSDFIND